MRLPTPSDGPLRDLRRGLFRSVPFVVLGALSLFGDTATGVVAITFCLGWIPLTLIEGWTARRDWSLASVMAGVFAVWIFVAALLAGATLQFGYVEGLSQGLTPRAAVTAVSIPWKVWNDLVPVTAFLATALSTHLTVRVLVHQGRDAWQDWFTILKLVLTQALLAGAVTAAVENGLMATMVVVALLVWTTIALAGFLILTLPADAAEAAIWPPGDPRPDDSENPQNPGLDRTG